MIDAVNNSFNKYHSRAVAVAGIGVALAIIGAISAHYGGGAPCQVGAYIGIGLATAGVLAALILYYKKNQTSEQVAPPAVTTQQQLKEGDVSAPGKLDATGVYVIDLNKGKASLANQANAQQQVQQEVNTTQQRIHKDDLFAIARQYDLTVCTHPVGLYHEWSWIQDKRLTLESDGRVLFDGQPVKQEIIETALKDPGKAELARIGKQYLDDQRPLERERERRKQELEAIRSNNQRLMGRKEAFFG